MYDFLYVVNRHISSKLLSFWENRVICILATDRQIDRQTDEQMDSIDALSRSRCHERRLNNSVTLKSRLRFTQGHWKNGTIRKIRYGFLFAFRSNMAVFYHFGCTARYWSQIALFSYPLHSTPSLGGRGQKIAVTFCLVQKTRMVWLLDSEKSLMIYLAVSTQYRRVRQTDRQTDRRTNILREHSIAR